MDLEQTRQQLRISLEEKFLLYHSSDKVDARELPTKGKLWAGYSIGDFTPRGRESTHFDLNLWDQTCFINFITIDETLRGIGLGWQLYEAIHLFAKRQGCKQILETPSGGVYVNGKMVETRKDYMTKKGYEPVGENIVRLTI